MVRMWDEQLERMERYCRRCEEIEQRGVTPESAYDDEDTFYSFFIHCLHLKDWFARDTPYSHRPLKDTTGQLACGCCRIGPDSHPCSNKDCAECYLRSNVALKLCQDIANGIKHLNLGSAIAGIIINHPRNTATLFVRDRHGRTYRAIKAVIAAREAWKDFTLQTGAVGSEKL